MSNTKIRTEILTNLRAVAGSSRQLSRSVYRYSSKRKFASSTVEKTFGTFTRARVAAGLKSL
jgi:hypothetical protein